MSNDRPTPPYPTAKNATKLENVALPVSDVDRANRFYQGLGWRLDGDFSDGKGWRVVQLTPPGSACSVFFGSQVTTVAPGSVQGTFLVVDDIAAACAELRGFGVDVSAPFHFDDGLQVVGTERRRPGPDPEGRSYSSFASFRDPDGNGWMLQEIKTRLPGRGVDLNATTLPDLLREAETRHGDYEPTAPKHHWSDWYAGYVLARAAGRTPEEAAKDAAIRVEGIAR